MPGRALPAAQPHTELTTIIRVPAVPVTAASTSSRVRSSLTPIAVSSWRIGSTKNSGYGMGRFYGKPRSRERFVYGRAGFCEKLRAGFGDVQTVFQTDAELTVNCDHR